MPAGALVVKVDRSGPRMSGQTSNKFHEQDHSTSARLFSETENLLMDISARKECIWFAADGRYPGPAFEGPIELEARSMSLTKSDTKASS